MRIDRKSSGAAFRAISRRALIVMIASAVAAAGFFVDAAPAHADTIGPCTFPTSPTPTVFAHCTDMNLSGQAFGNVDLSYGDFTNSNFDNATFNGTLMNDIHMSGASFQGAQFSGSIVDGSPQKYLVNNGNDADAGNIDFSGASFRAYGVELYAPNSNFTHTSWTGGSVLAGEYPGSAFDDSLFCGDGPCGGFGFYLSARTNLSGTSIKNAHFVGLKEYESNPGGSDFSNADLTGTDMNGASLAGSNFTGARLTQLAAYAADFSGDSMVNADLTGAYLDSDNLSADNLSGANLSGATLDSADMTSATLAGATLSHTLLAPDRTVQTLQASAPVNISQGSLPGATALGCDPPSGSTFPAGTTLVTCRVKDGQNNVASGVAALTVETPRIAMTVPAGGSLGTPWDLNAANPIEVVVITPNAGDVSIVEQNSNSIPPTGYHFLGLQENIEAPPASISAPLSIGFLIDPSVIPPGGINDVVLYRDTVPITDMCDSSGTAGPDGICIAGRKLIDGGVGLISVRTSHASQWNFATPFTSFAVFETTLPAARLGQPYTATLHALNGVAPLKWKKIGKLPRGLKLNAKTGVISGTPKKLTGTFAFTIQVTDSKKPKPKHVATQRFTITIQ